ncbi:DUF2147 domain-containing protein [Gangjinia marincola]
MKRVFICFVALIFFSPRVISQEVTGSWKTIDDESGVAKSIVEIYEDDGKLYGKVVRILKESERDRICTLCKGQDKNQPIEGLVILKDLEYDQGDDEFEDGTVTDPENGKVYDVKIWLDEDNPDLLNVRGYIAFFYRTQQWKRVK